MEYLKLDKEYLRAILAEAFEEGWSGYKELQDEVVERILEKCNDKVVDESFTVKDNPFVATINWDNGLNSNYHISTDAPYFTFSTTPLTIQDINTIQQQ
jgi:hypothetical protein